MTNLTKKAQNGTRAIVVSCRQCGKPAATIELTPSSVSDDSKASLRVIGFIGVITAYWLGSKPLTDQTINQVQTLASTDLKDLRSLDRDLFGFICRECGAAYCRNCWSNYYVSFDEGFYDATRATCPRGHEQMVQD